MSAKAIKGEKKNKATILGNGGVFYTFPQGEGGPIEIRIDFGQVPEPTNYYYADSLLLRLDEEQHIAILSFGRRDENTNKFAQRIDVAMPMKSLFGPVWASLEAIESTLDQILEVSGGAAKVRPVTSEESAAATLFANTIFAALGDGESAVDFYHLSPRDVHLAKTQRANMQIHAVVRVMMSSVLTKHLFDTLRPYKGRGAALQPTLEGGKRAVR